MEAGAWHRRHSPLLAERRDRGCTTATLVGPVVRAQPKQQPHHEEYAHGIETPISSGRHDGPSLRRRSRVTAAITTHVRAESCTRFAGQACGASGIVRTRRSDQCESHDDQGQVVEDATHPNGGPRWTRTTYLRVISTALCQLV